MATSCTDTSNEREQTISSPNFPSNYGSNQHCTWTIEAPVGRIVRLDTFSYEIEYGTVDCLWDALRIYDGESASEINEIAELCGLNSKSGIASTGNSLYLEFSSNHEGFMDYEGFKIHYSIKGIFF